MNQQKVLRGIDKTGFSTKKYSNTQKSISKINFLFFFYFFTMGITRQDFLQIFIYHFLNHIPLILSCRCSIRQRNKKYARIVEILQTKYSSIAARSFRNEIHLARCIDKILRFHTDKIDLLVYTQCVHSPRSYNHLDGRCECQ